jgi:hypothetical protein
MESVHSFVDHCLGQSTMDQRPWHGGGSLELALQGVVAHRRSPVVAREQEGVTTIIVDVGWWRRGHSVSWVMTLGGGGQRSLVCRRWWSTTWRGGRGFSPVVSFDGGGNTSSQR